MDLISKTMGLHEIYNNKFIDELNLHACLTSPEIPSFGFVRSFPLPKKCYPIFFKQPGSDGYYPQIPQQCLNHAPKENKVKEYVHEDTDPEVTPTNSNQNMEKPPQPSRHPLYDSENRLTTVEILKNPKNLNENLTKKSLNKQELLRDQFKLQKKLKKIETHRKEMMKIMKENKCKKMNENIEETKHQDSYFDETEENIEDFSESEGDSEDKSQESQENKHYIKTDEEFITEESLSDDSLPNEVLEHLVINTETDGENSVDLEYEERLQKENELNKILKEQEKQLLLRKTEIESEIKSRRTEVGSPKSAADIENKEIKSFSIENYQKKKHNKGDIKRPMIPKATRGPLQSSSVLNLTKSKSQNKILKLR